MLAISRFNPTIMANNITNASQVERYLRGLDYPAAKDKIVDHAKNAGANEDAVGVLMKIADKEYSNQGDVMQEITKAISS